ncbi:MAG: PilZ domain-containing protein [Desulfovibrionaceae bacterium]|nr:PilZ domain-containing protein [Desulfovibrionaceae bacterium]
MGIIDFITSLFSKSGNGAGKRNKTTARKTAPKKKARRESSSNGEAIKLSCKAKGRKKSEEVTADPIDAAALGFSISLKNSDELARKRGAIRIRVKGLAVRIPRLKKIIKVADISATGLGFPFEKPRIKGGVELKMDLILDKKVVAKDVMCKVMRHEGGLVGCRFVELDRAQDDAVSKVVLLGQKQMAERKKARKDAEFKIPT